MDKEVLLKLGFSRREVEAYFVLVNSEEATASEISNKTNESRTNTYDTLNSLIKKGIVSFIVKNNTKYFIAASPKKLLDWIELKKSELLVQQALVEKLVPEISRIRKVNEKKVAVEVFEGVEGVRTVLRETLESCKNSDRNFLVFGAIADKLREWDPIFHKKYYKERLAAKIRTRYISIKGTKLPSAPLSEYRYLPKEFKSFAATSIHGDEVSFWLVTNPPVVILIKDKNFADTYRSNFEVLWKMARVG
jgi:sugar-specific transcriptional regulator TrmB